MRANSLLWAPATPAPSATFAECPQPRRFCGVPASPRDDGRQGGALPRRWRFLCNVDPREARMTTPSARPESAPIVRDAQSPNGKIRPGFLGSRWPVDQF